MKRFIAIQRKKISAFVLLFLVTFLAVGNVPQIFAHGGEDHGDSQPKTITGTKGSISHTARLGEIELMLKHPALEPDAATAARLFITKFETNEPMDKAAATIEFESTSGAVTQALVEKTETAGSYSVKIPALPEGDYIVRAKLTYNNETDTATFSGVKVAHAPAASDESGMSWTRTALIVFLFVVVLALLGGLVYFVWNFAGDKPVKGKSIREETVSA